MLQSFLHTDFSHEKLGSLVPVSVPRFYTAKKFLSFSLSPIRGREKEKKLCRKPARKTNEWLLHSSLKRPILCNREVYA
jgi:hypothetical protein